MSGARSGGSAYSSEFGFFAGGQLSNQTDSKFANWTADEAEVLNTLLTYNMENNTFTNKTTPLDPFTLSNLVYVPVGEQGILLSLGGASIPKGVFNWSATDLKNVPPPPHLAFDCANLCREIWTQLIYTILQNKVGTSKEQVGKYLGIDMLSALQSQLLAIIRPSISSSTGARA